ncbi:MAG: MBOAT family protein [Leptospirales bacterium]|nr:MBOAT family protein [Leptospirales bacterium]
MLFVTGQFLLFFLIVLVIHWSLPPRFRVWFLTAASLYFYASWNLLFTLHFVTVIGINWTVIELWRTFRKNWIFYSLQVGNVLNLAFFKYFYFGADIIGRLTGLSWLSQPTLFESHRMLGHEILLPLAISFYTFQIMSYGFDIFREKYTEKNSLLEVLLFKAFFPQLIAGPIMRSHELLPQIRRAWTEGLPLDENAFYKGLWLCIIGIVKKVFLADQLTVFLSPIMAASDPGIYHPVYLWLTPIVFVAMVYADFSAYSDLARGFGLLMGFQVPVNFKAPLFMISVSDFWRRWHITLSLWLRDYVYIAMGGNRVSNARIYLNFIVTFFLGGLWHGAAYTFVVWGTMVGVMLSLEAFAVSKGIPEWPSAWWSRGLRLLVAHLMFWPSTIFFMAPSWSWSIQALPGMFNLRQWLDVTRATPAHLETVAYCAAGILFFHLFDEFHGRLGFIRRFEKWLIPLVSIAMIIGLSQFTGGQKDFFYFQF